jgi:hypothetical protein
MSRGRSGYAYAQARLQARLGTDADIAALERAHAARDLASFLQLARSTPLAHHVARIAPDTPVHDIERRLREEWQATVDEVAGWQPRHARPCVRWLRWLPYLPALQKLGRGGRPPAWSREDPLLGRIVAADAPARADALAATALAPLAPAVASGAGVASGWMDHWRTTWPRATAEHSALERVVREVRLTDAILRDAPPTASTAEALATLAPRLRHAFRRNPLSVVAAVTWLALVALDLLALRGALARRAALPQGNPS